MRALSRQENLLTEVRERTGLLLAATAVATSLLGGRALDDGERTVIDLVAIALALLSLVLSVYVLAPKRDLTFALIRFFKWACYALVGAVVLWSVGLAIQ